MVIGFRLVSSGGDLLRMGGVQPSKLAESSTVTGLSYLEDGQFAKIYKVSFLDSALTVLARVVRQLYF